MTSKTAGGFCVLAGALVFTVSLAGEDWRQFRGSNSNSSAGDARIPLEWSENNNVAWRTPIPGKGASGPIVVGHRIFVTRSGGIKQNRLYVLCVDARTGRQLWRRDFWATGRTYTHPSSSVAAPTPASDGKRVVAFFSSNDLVCLDLEGNLLRRLTSELGYDAEGAYSRDGKQIAFCSTRDGDPDLYVMNADGSNVRQLTNAEGYDGGPFISPDGNWVVFRSDRKKSEYLQIHVIGIDGKNGVALTDTNGVNWAPYWHPHKPYIIWTGADHSDPTARPNYDLWLMKYEIQDGRFHGHPPVRVTDHAAGDVLPVFSPDGKKLMWTSTRTEQHTSQLFIANFHLPR